MFVITDFLRHLSPEMLEAYCAATKLDFTFSESSEPQEIAESFTEYLSEQVPNTRATVELNFQEIEEIVGEKGSMMLIEEANSRNTSLAKGFEELSNYDKAMWFFLNQRDIFDEVAIEYEIEHSVGWLPYNVKPVDEKNALGKEKELADAVSKFYLETEYRGDICQAECVQKNDYICYIAYPRDYVDREISYDEKKQLNKANHRQPVFKVFFLYSPSEQRVSVKVKGGKVKKEALIRIFVETVLGQKLSSRQKVLYDLNVLKNFHHSFSTPIADKVENVKVIELRLVYLNSNGRRMVLSVKKDGFGMEDMGRFIEESGVPLNQIIITQAKIHVKFKPEFKRAKGTVTAQITAPDSCNLGVKKNDRKVRQYLKDWGIDKSEL